ncbi:MAG: AraC family transcriptional regulator [Cyclobacteriaceae bacterium]|nr:AraC family transcriptional regulator [Cyclobacteriaceae bacterium]
MKHIRIFDDHATFISPAIQTDQHKHHALEIIVSRDGMIHIEDALGNVLVSKAVLVLPDQLHQTTTNNETAFIFIEPESDLAKAILTAFNPTQSVQSIEGSISEADRKAFAGGSKPTSLTKAIRSVNLIDDRIQRVTDFIRSHITTHEFSLEMLAEMACLSTSRFTHLFKVEVGIPLRPFILWCRMRVAVTSVLAGMTITQAAYEAGFSDTAHLSRTFMDMFGVNPSAVLKQ